MRTLAIVCVVAALQVYCLFAAPNTRDDGWLDLDDAGYGEGPWDDAERQTVQETIRDALIIILEELRQGIVTGWPELNIPPLDPLHFTDFPFNVTFENSTDNVYGNFLTSELVYLSTFKTTQVLVDLNFDLFVNLALELAQLELHGAYDMDGHALGLHVYGDGDYHIDLNDVKMGFYFRAGVGDWGRHYRVKDLASDLMLRDADVRFEHLLGGGITGGLVNQALSQELPLVLGVLEELVMPRLLEVLQTQINDYLEQFPVLPDWNFTWPTTPPPFGY